MTLENILGKKKRHLVNQRNGNSPGAGAGDGIFMLLFLIPVAIPYIALFLGIPFFIYFIFLVIKKNSSKSLPKMEVMQVTPAGEGKEPMLPQNNPMPTPAGQHRTVQIRPPRTSQIILLIVMVTLILGCVVYLLTH